MNRTNLIIDGYGAVGWSWVGLDLAKFRGWAADWVRVGEGGIKRKVLRAGSRFCKG